MIRFAGPVKAALRARDLHVPGDDGKALLAVPLSESMRQRSIVAVALAALGAASACHGGWRGRSRPGASAAGGQATSPASAGSATSVPVAEARFLSRTRQLVFAGARSGEGYFSADGSLLSFQSEREPGDPFYQIYVMSLETGDVRRVSPGFGKATCSWLYPDGRRVLFASTHEDPDARRKQEQEVAVRASGTQRRYAWDFDERFDIFAADLGDRATGSPPSPPRNLTQTRGYDAEGSYSPDGKLIVFASNRHAFTDPLTAEEKSRLEADPSSFVDIYLMDADGGNVRRLTTSPGYDGGPFFSPDGKRIVWRRFSLDGKTAEIDTMRLDGGDVHQLTHLGAVSWAPFYHPSGDYVIFASNPEEPGNFELYIVDARGKSEPVRVTFSDGFDGLPAFSPDGRTLAFTSSRTADRKPQIFLADWDDAAARAALHLEPATAAAPAQAAAAPRCSAAPSAIDAADLEKHVRALAADAMEGRATGTEGERRATAYVADAFRAIGLVPAGDGGSFFQSFPFAAGVSLGPTNRLELVASGGVPGSFPVDQAWRPLAFSQSGDVPASGVVFAGYGIVAPAGDGQPAYDSYGGLDVKDKWVLVLRYLPDDVTPEMRQHLGRFSPLRYKATAARDRGARGMIVASGPNARVKSQLVALAPDAGLAGPSSIAAISVTDELADEMISTSGTTLRELQEALDRGQSVPGFALEGVKLAARVDLREEKREGRNVLGRLVAGPRASREVLVIGAHVDHLGRGEGSSSLAREDEKGAIHPGADDNASGVAGLIEIARDLARLKARGALPMKRDVVFAAWSGEELGLLGSSHYARNFAGGGGEPQSLRPGVYAYLNMDMIGRLRAALVVQGVGSSSVWPQLIEQADACVGMPIQLEDQSYLPTDTTSFYAKGVPVLAAFTGGHAEYHTPRDTPDRVNFAGAEQVARFMENVARDLAARADAPDYRAMEKPAAPGRGSMRIYLGTIPDYTAGNLKGVKLTGTAKGGPAEVGGLQAGDVIVELGGRRVENIYDYTYALENLKVGTPVEVVVLRAGKRVPLRVTPASRE